MNRIWILFITALSVTLLTLFLLATGSSLLTISLNDSGTIPLGTFITWAGMIGLSLTIYSGIRDLREPAAGIHKILALLLRFVLVLAILWVPLSYLLAGNLSFSFSQTTAFQGGQTAWKLFRYLSSIIGVGPLIILLFYGVSLIFKRKRY
ncbi:hypothetical protein [Robertkochia aurantiaca]|uniref:hypothetical protein n=1 Tax=Robertkochia aurantiaca TaxID=2873700 RepID=UPI001CCEE48D|nr:hypothetical protein [Robertkochia sp. 3YJGBD-33]